MSLLIHKPRTVIKVRIRCAAVVFLALLNSSGRANAPVPRVEPSKTMPAELGAFHLVGQAKQSRPAGSESALPELSTPPLLVVMTDARYASADGVSLSVSVFRWESDAAAYSGLTNWCRINRRELDSAPDRIGTASGRIQGRLMFFKGSVSVAVSSEDDVKPDRTGEFARLFAATLSSGQGDIPVLVKHLPNWEVAQSRAVYAVSSRDLALAIPNQPILNAVSFEGGTEAVVANYGQSQLVIVEFTTPQFSIDNDSRIWTKLAALKSQGQPTPTAYRRVGNYSVFVFNAPDEQTANALVEQVKYEQVVQWLGDDPHLYERLQRYFTQTSAGVLVAVLKSSGLSLLLCLAAGGLIGAMLFRHRRAQKAAAYSDAGGSIRLNLDELTGPANTRRFLKSGSSSEQSSSNS